MKNTCGWHPSAQYPLGLLKKLLNKVRVGLASGDSFGDDPAYSSDPEVIMAEGLGKVNDSAFDDTCGDCTTAASPSSLWSSCSEPWPRAA